MQYFKTHKNTSFVFLRFFHPDYTVGMGFLTHSAISARLRLADL